MAKLNRIIDRDTSDQDDVKIDIDLAEMFNSNVPDSTSFRQRVGQSIIDKIRDRSESGIFLNNAKKTYSDEYAESIEFKAFGKKKSEVNLTQTGDMLGLLDIIEESGDKITIGWTDPLQSNKAHGHITGNVGSKRDFLGLPLSDLEKIASEFSEEIGSEQSDIETKSSVNLIQSFLSKGLTGNKLTGVSTVKDIIKSILGGESDESI